MPRIPGYDPLPGPQQPEKYPFVGRNYKIKGEQTGFIYDPYTDRYYADPRARKKQYEDAGLIDKPKSPPGLAEQLLPIGAAAGALYLGKGIGKKAPEYLGDLWGGAKEAAKSGASEITGMFKSGLEGVEGPAAVSAPTAATADTGAAGLRSAAPPEEISGMFSPQGSSMVVQSGQALPEGYTAVGTAGDGGTLAVPSSSITPEGGVNVGQVAQGAAGAYQLYQGFQDLRKGDYLSGGINSLGGATLVGSALGNETATAALPIVGPVVGAWGLKNMADFVGSAPSGGRRNSSAAIQGAASGAAIGSAIPGVGTVAGAFVGGLTGLASSLFGSSKSGDQMIRDQGRKVLQQGGLLDENWQGTLADGSKFDFGKDGKGLTKIKYDDPVTSRVIGLANVLASGEGAYGGATQAMAHLYTGAALSNSGGDYEKARQNMLHFAQQRGFNPQNVSQQLQKMKDEGQISDQQYQAYLGGLNELFRGAPMPRQQAPAPTPAPAAPAPAAPAPSNEPTGMLQPETPPAKKTGAQLAAERMQRRNDLARNGGAVTGMFR